MNFVIVDTETTGLNTQTARVIEVGAVKVSGNEITKVYQELLNSVDNIPYFVQNLTGITSFQLMMEGKDPKEELIKIREFIGDDIFVAHNVTFDYRFLNSEFRRYEIPVLENERICTCLTSKKIWPELHNHKLTTIKEFLEIENVSHRALDDAMVCFEILKQAVEKDLI